jgi:hypothetical protein
LRQSQFIPPNDKFSKIHPLVVRLNERFMNKVCVDEAMIAYYGPHGCKQMIRNKSIRFGFKAWCLNDKHGYFLQHDLYQGKDNNPDAQSDLGKGGEVVMKEVSILKSFIQPHCCKVYFDNYFTSAKLLKWLSDFGFGGTGNLRKNRKGKDASMKLKQLTARGESDLPF